MIDMAKSFKKVFSKSQKQVFINQVGNWEWALLIKAISSTGN